MRLLLIALRRLLLVLFGVDLAECRLGRNDCSIDEAGMEDGRRLTCPNQTLTYCCSDVGKCIKCLSWSQNFLPDALWNVKPASDSMQSSYDAGFCMARTCK